MRNKMSLTIGWLYPDLMSTYGDRGNIICLKKRCEWRGISVTVLPIKTSTAVAALESIDILFGGGAQDVEQSIVIKDLKIGKGRVIKELIEEGLPALFVCGAPQLMGEYYEPSKGQRLEGVGIFDMISVHPGPDSERLIGNVVAQVGATIIVGFENHGGRTYLGKNAQPFARVIQGYGNNGEDKTEGVVYKNAIGCYFHGPLLPKNPEIADELITKALKRKYKKNILLSKMDDSLAQTARRELLKKYS